MDHETVERRCDCDNNHNYCEQKCDQHPDDRCIWIANHKGSHDCAICLATL